MIPAIAAGARWKKSSALHSRISSPSPRHLTDHLMWQLGAIPIRPEVREAAELIIGNLNEDGYLIASDEELLGIAPPAPPEADAAVAENVVKEAAALGLAATRRTGGAASRTDVTRRI